MTASRIQGARAEIDRLTRQIEDARSAMTRELQDAQQAGATIAQLQEWSGYSRRQVFNLLR